MSFIKSIPLIFYSRRFYADLVRHGKGIGMGFLLVQIVLSLAIPAGVMIANIPVVTQKIWEICGQLPAVAFRDYKLSIDQPSPYTVKIAGDDKKTAFIVFDMTSGISDVKQIDAKLKEEGDIGLVTPDFLAMRKRQAVELYNFRDYGTKLKDFSFSHDQWIAFGQKLAVWDLPIFSGFLLFFFLIGKLMSTFFEALIVKLGAAVSKSRIDFAGAMRLSAAAAVPVCAVDFLLAAGSLLTHRTPSYSLSFYVVVLIWLGFVAFGLFSANDRVSKT